MKFQQIDGKMLKRIRENNGKSQAELAELAGLSSQTISNIECNRSGAAGQRPETVALIAKALDVDERELLMVAMTVDAQEDFIAKDDDMEVKDLSLSDFVQLTEAEKNPKKFVDDHYIKNNEYVDELIEAFENKGNRLYARFVSDLKHPDTGSLMKLCNIVLVQMRCGATRNDDDGMYFRKNSEPIIQAIGNTLRWQINRLQLTTHFDREMIITLVIQSAYELYDVLSSNVDRDRLTSLILSIQKNRFELNQINRVQDLINLYFFVCERWKILRDHSDTYWLLEFIACVLEDAEIDADDLIARECIARIIFKTLYMWEKLSYSRY